MKSVIIDSTDKVIYEGKDAEKVLMLLLSDPSDITEQEEIKYGDVLRNTEWEGELKFEHHFDLKFRGIDDWNRAVFKDVDGFAHFGDVNHLWDWNTPKEDVIKHYQEDDGGLEYFGISFDCEPTGGRSSIWKFNFIL